MHNGIIIRGMRIMIERESKIALGVTCGVVAIIIILAVNNRMEVEQDKIEIAMKVCADMMLPPEEQQLQTWHDYANCDDVDNMTFDLDGYLRHQSWGFGL